MKQKDLWKLSLLNVFASPLRSILTVLGMAIGVGAILAVLTLGDAGKTQVRSEMSRLGIDRVWLTAVAAEPLRVGDAALLTQMLQMQATEQIYLPVTITCGEKHCTATAIGCENGYLNMAGLQSAEGRMLYPLEWTAGSRSILLGQELAEKLQAFPGDAVQIQNVTFIVRGTVQEGGSFSRADAALSAFLPLEVLSEWTGEQVHEVMMSIPEHMTPQEAAVMAETVMETRRNVAVESMTMQVQMEAADSVIAIFVDVLKWVALICILVGGIGVMNILLVSVRERRREIGIMKSLGTTHVQICMLFLMEALVYAAVGGALGVMIGFALIDAAGRSIGLMPVVRAMDCMLVTAAAMAVGLVSGVTPAYRASCLKPVDALRLE